jgi:ribonuclease P protein component
MAPKTFPKSARLIRTADYRKVYAEGRRRNLGWAVAFVLANGKAESRVGLTVSGTLGGAVVRNRIKRRLRAAVRENLSLLAPGCDIVLHARSAALMEPFDKMAAALRKLFQSCASLAAAKTASRHA